MIYILGDTHGDINVIEKSISGISSLSADDVLLIPGEFGYVMFGEGTNEREKHKLDTISRFSFTILFVDGNHEGFPYLMQYPQEIRFGAPVRRIRDNIFWLQRGYIYTIQGKTFFTMGGAYSMDKARRLAYEEKYGVPIWFKEELPSDEEYRRAIRTLEEHNYQVDYILTHTAPASIIPRVIGAYPDHHDRELTGFLDWVYHEVNFKKWFFGHFHVDKVINEQMIACFRIIHAIR